MENNMQFQQNLNEQTMTLGDWLVTLLLTAIPFVNIILLIVWAFSSNTNLNKKNYSKAMLIFMSIGIVLTILLMGCAVTTLANMH